MVSSITQDPYSITKPFKFANLMNLKSPPPHRLTELVPGPKRALLSLPLTGTTTQEGQIIAFPHNS